MAFLENLRAALAASDELSALAEREHMFDIDFDAVKSSLLDAEMDMLWDILENKIEDEEDDDSAFDHSAFIRGFVNEVSEVWHQLKDKV